jgi:hypothetical protein
MIMIRSRDRHDRLIEQRDTDAIDQVPSMATSGGCDAHEL